MKIYDVIILLFCGLVVNVSLFPFLSDVEMDSKKNDDQQVIWSGIFYGERGKRDDGETLSIKRGVTDKKG